MTIEQVRAAIGHARPAWAEHATGGFCILVRAGRLGDAVLVRDCKRRGGYGWVDAGSLIRRTDMDNGPEPEWLLQARSSHRPPPILWDILNPAYSQRVLEEQRAAAGADPSTIAHLEEILELRRQAASGYGPMFDTDADGKVVR